MKERTILQTTLTETAFKEILRESFQDFELQDYKYSLPFSTGIIDNSAPRTSEEHKDYKDFIDVMRSQKIK